MARFNLAAASLVGRHFPMSEHILMLGQADA